MNLGNWDDDEDDIQSSLPTAGSSSAPNADDDLFDFADALTLRAEEPFEGEDEEDLNDSQYDFYTGENPNKKKKPPLPEGVRDLTSKRGVLLEITGTRNEDVKDNNEEPIKPSEENKFVEFHYDGYLQSNGEKFDSSRDQNYPMIVELDLPPKGQSSLIAGLELGLRELSPGDKATLSIKSKFAYGDKGADDIPPGSDLKFNVEIIDVRATHKRIEVVDHSKKDLSRLEDIRKEREIAQQRREEEAKAKDEEKKRKADRITELREKLANKNKGKKGGKKKK